MGEDASQHPGQLLVELFAAGVRAVHGRRRVRESLTAGTVPGPVGIIGLGKAAVPMCLGALDAVGPRVVQGLVVAPPGERNPSPGRVRLLAGSHPVPDRRSLEAGTALLDFLKGAPGTLLFLISGGSSSLVEVPRAGISLDQLRRAHRWLVGSGLPIDAVNAVRTRLSAIKGGGLLGFVGRRRVRALILSDVPGNDPAVVGSGPLAPGERPTLPRGLPGWLRALLPPATDTDPLPPGAAVDSRVIAGIEDAMQAVLVAARAAGLAAHAQGALAGDARDAASRLVTVLRDAAPGVHVWGGETTVTLPDAAGYGGRNQHLALAAALALTGRDDVWLLAAGTDGVDGNTSHAGAVVDGTTVERAARAGMDPRAMLAGADSGTVFERLGDALVTGATGTNVMDLVIALKRA